MKLSPHFFLAIALGSTIARDLVPCNEKFDSISAKIEIALQPNSV
jgi:hypothetical protein